MRAQLRAWRLGCIWVAAVAGCASPAPQLPTPEFPPPKQGVFQPAVPLVAGPGDAVAPSLAPRGGWLVYSARAAGNLDVMLQSVSGGASRRLTTHSTDDSAPRFSPSGELIAWVSAAEDVKGDIWVMHRSGADKRRLTGAATADAAPSWGPQGQRIYFASRPAGSLRQRIEVYDREYGTRRVVVDDGWDPAVSPDGRFVFFVRLDAHDTPRLWAHRLADGREVIITQRAAVEGLPTTVSTEDGKYGLIFARFVDDANRDGRIDGNDAPSLWWLPFDPEVYAGAEPPAALPLTSGAGSELLASGSGDWLAYTTRGVSDLDIYALPQTGMIARSATPEALLAAARQTPRPARQRLALRYVIAAFPEFAPRARYTLAQHLVRHGKFADALQELESAAAQAPKGELRQLAQLEHIRVRMLARLGGEWMARRDAERRFVREQLARIKAMVGAEPPESSIGYRAHCVKAEADLALGNRAQAVATFERLGSQPRVSDADAARALTHLALVYARMQNRAALERVGSRLLQRFPERRQQTGRVAERWVEAVLDASETSRAAALRAIMEEHAALGAVAARAALALAQLQVEADHAATARATLHHLVDTYPDERSIVARALRQIARVAAGEGRRNEALAAYEALLAQFGNDPKLRGQARQGITRIALQKARSEQAAGELDAARRSYARLLRSRSRLVVAHRNFIDLSFRLGHGEAVLRRYRRAVQATPRDKVARYGYALALSYKKPLPAAEVAQQLDAALRLDPRFGAAHLTYGWLELQRELREPGQQWLERAQESFETARQLLDREGNPELWAATQLNKGHALLALKKPDLAFQAYMQRERSGVAFRALGTELTFREAFARAAFRQEVFDVALDMARQALNLLPEGSQTEHRAALTALIAATHLQIGNSESRPQLAQPSYARAAQWYAEAEALYRRMDARRQVVVMLRGQMLAHLRQGHRQAALALVQRQIELLQSAVEAPEDTGGALTIERTFPVDPTNVTRGSQGFAPHVETELAHAYAARIFAEQGALDAARRFDATRLRLLRAAARTAGTAAMHLELLHALHESALLAARAGELTQAVSRWQEAVQLSVEHRRWGALERVLEALATLWSRHPAARTRTAVQTARGAANHALDHVLSRGDAGREQARAFARWLALEHLAAALSPTRAAPQRAGQSAQAARTGLRQRLSGRLRALTGAARAVQQADAYARLAGDTGLRQALRPYKTARPRRPRPRSNQWDPSVQHWRRAFSAALAADTFTNPKTLARLLRLLEREPAPAAVPERDALWTLGVRHHLQQDKPRAAWALLERRRLLRWQPPPRRLGNTRVARRWEALRALRAKPKQYRAELDAASALLRALEAQPLSLQSIQAALGGAALLQAHAIGPGRWVWFLVTADAVQHIASGPLPKDGTLPAAVSARLDKTVPKGSVLYVDTGELVERPLWQLRLPKSTLGRRYLVSEALSATYLIAARRARNNPQGPVLAIGATSASTQPRGIPAALVDADVMRVHAQRRRGIYVGLRGRLQTEAFAPPGQATITFSLADAKGESQHLDLSDIGGHELDANIAVFGSLDTHPRARRLLTQAALLAGIPTVVVGANKWADVNVASALIEQGQRQRHATAFARLLRDTDATPQLHLLGAAGMRYAERVEYAVEQLLGQAARASAAFKEARQRNADEAWRQAKAIFDPLIETVGFLNTEASRAVLQRSSQPRARAILQHLPRLTTSNRTALAQIQAALGQVEAAVALQELVIEGHDAKGNAAAALQAIVNLGKMLANAKQHARAAAAFERCVQRAQEVGDSIVEAECSWRFGSQKRAKYQYEAAIEAYRRALTLYGRTQHGDRIYPLRYLGYIYKDALNDYDAALEQFTAALDIAEASDRTALVPELMLEIGRVYRNQGAYGRALTQARSALEQLEEAPAGQRAEAIVELAKVYWYRGNYRRATQRQKRALELARAAGNSFLEIQAISLAGLIALNQGELRRAERSIRAALDLARSTDRAREQATQLNNLGIVLREAGRLDEAIERFRAALRIDQKLQTPQGKAFDLRNLAVALQRRGNSERALRAINRALELSREIGNRYNELRCLFARGEILHALGRAAGRQMYAAAARLAARIAVPEVQWRALYALGRLREAAGAKQAARRLYQQALGVAEQLGRGGAQLRGKYTRRALYTDALRLARAADEPARVFELMERARARALLDVLATHRLDFPDPRAKTLLRAVVDARDAWHQARSSTAAPPQDGARAASTEALPEPQASAQQDWENSLHAAQARYASARAELRAAYPRLARLMTIEPARLQSLQARLPAGAAVLSFFAAERQLWVQIIRADTTAVRTLPLTRAELQTRVSQLQGHMEVFGDVAAQLERLSEQLLAPLASDLEALDKLIVIPDGPLFAVPFPALSLRQSDLLELMPVTHAASASMLTDRLARPAPAPPSSVAAFAPAADLPFARFEAASIAPANVFIGPRASEPKVRSAAVDALAVATHATLDSSAPLSSRLQLAPGPDAGHASDGKLEMWEIFGWSTNLSLVTLSACHSGASVDVRGDGWLGLAGAFLRAGVPTVVASQNRVSDLAAAVLMKRFYRLVDETSRGEALRRAALWTRRFFEHPAHWAQFVLYGDFR